jgi:hypothetical protein
MQSLIEQNDALSQPSEAGSLAFEMAREFNDMVHRYREDYGLTLQEAMSKAGELAGHEDRVLKGPPRQLGWLDLARLTQHDPKLAAKRWEEAKSGARNELISGHRSALAVEGAGHDLWKRCEFLALRDEFRQTWQPKNGIEGQLVDMLAENRMAILHWQQVLTDRTTSICINQPLEGAWAAPTVSASEALEQAAGMLDRFNRIFMRTLRALRDLRRYSVPVVIQNAGQVNVAEQQVNVAGPQTQRANKRAARSCRSPMSRYRRDRRRLKAPPKT